MCSNRFLPLYSFLPFISFLFSLSKFSRLDELHFFVIYFFFYFVQSCEIFYFTYFFLQFLPRYPLIFFQIFIIWISFLGSIAFPNVLRSEIRNLYSRLKLTNAHSNFKSRRHELHVLYFVNCSRNAIINLDST